MATSEPMIGGFGPSMLGRDPGGLADRLLFQRIVVVADPVDATVGGQLCGSLLLLAADDPAAEVTMYVSASQGTLAGALAVVDTMRAMPNGVVTVALGDVGGVGQLVLSAGTRGRRFALPHSRIELCRMQPAGLGQAVGLRGQADSLATAKVAVAELVADLTGQPYDQVVADCDAGRSFEAAEAASYGLVDSVITSLVELVPASRPALGIG